MAGRGSKKERNGAREQAADIAARFDRLERSHRGLERLYEVSKLLTRSQPVPGMVTDVVGVLARTLPLHSAIFIQESDGEPRTMVWQAKGDSAKRLRQAKDHAQEAYRYLVRSGVDFPREETGSLGLPATGTGWKAPPKDRFVMLPLVVDGPIFGAVQVEDARELDEMDLVFVNAVVNQLSVAIDRHLVIGAQQVASEAREREQRLMAQVSEAVSGSSEFSDALAGLARFIVPELADACCVDEGDADGSLRRREVRFADEAKHWELAEPLKQLLARAAQQNALAEVIETGEPRLFSDIGDPLAEGIAPDEAHAELLRAMGVRSMMTVPLSAHGRRLGVLSLYAAESGRRYSQHDLALTQKLAYRAALVLDNARLYEAAQRAVRSRKDLLAIVSHDLKNPLGVIRLHSQVLLGVRPRAEDRRSSRRQLEAIQRSADQMNHLINDLLTVASVESGSFVVAQQRIDPAALVSDALEMLQPVAEGRSLRIVDDLPADLPDVLADATRVQQVLGNLIGNAIKFSPESGCITVSAVPLQHDVAFAVTDTGAGIAAADLPRLFDRFWQVERTARLGTGLGLFITKGIVEAHGGNVWIESELGAGTTAFFTLPMAPPGDSPDDSPHDDGRGSPDGPRMEGR